MSDAPSDGRFGWKHWAAFIAATGGLLGGLGTFLNWWSPNPSGTTASVTTTTQAPVVTSTSVSAPPPSTAIAVGSPPANALTSAPGGLIWTSRETDIASGYYLDLDSTPPKVGQTGELGYGATSQVNNEGSFFSDGATTLAVLPAGTSGSYGACVADTRYVSEINMSDITDGAQICASTPAHRVALLTAVHVDHQGLDFNGGYIGLAVTVWQGGTN